jgi:hypothetical protein
MGVMGGTGLAEGRSTDEPSALTTHATGQPLLLPPTDEKGRLRVGPDPEGRWYVLKLVQAVGLSEGLPEDEQKGSDPLLDSLRPD